MRSFLIATAVMISGVFAQLPEKCPDRTSIQSDEVKNNFNMTAFLGYYYEIAYHDYTQPDKICGCQRSHKVMDDVTNHSLPLHDLGSLNCGNIHGNQSESHTYATDLKFYFSDMPGQWNGKWDLFPDVNFPDTLVDVGAVQENGQYAWVLEIQCVEELGHVAFIGVNFYSAAKDHRYLKAMSDAATKYGIDKFIYPDVGPQLTLVDQAGCTYNNTMYSEEMPDADTAAEHVHTLKMNALEETTLNVALESLYDEDKVAYVQDMVDGDFAKITPVN